VGFLGQLAHFVGNDGKATALFARAGRLDGGIECQQIGLFGDVLTSRVIWVMASVLLTKFVDRFGHFLDRCLQRHSFRRADDSALRLPSLARARLSCD
jgi:hypothetical protein